MFIGQNSRSTKFGSSSGSEGKALVVDKSRRLAQHHNATVPTSNNGQRQLEHTRKEWRPLPKMYGATTSHTRPSTPPSLEL